MKITSQHAMRSYARKTIGAGVRGDGRPDRLDAAAPGIAKVRKRAPFAAEWTVHLQARNVAFRSCKEAAARRILGR